MAHLTTKQIKQLCEIDSAGPGIRAEVQELITRLTSGGVGPKSDDPREVQAKRLWDKGFGRELRFGSFEGYLKSIPEIPEALKADSDRFPELVLVDARLGHEKTCKILGVDFDSNGHSFKDCDLMKARTEEVYWIRAQDGRKNSGKSIQTCHKQFVDGEIGLTVHEGLALFAQNPEGLRGRAMDLFGSVHSKNRSCAACMHWFFERPKLDWGWGVIGGLYYGSASRTE